VTERLLDQDARDRIARDLDESQVVEAAAGTGKTAMLVERVAGLLTTGRGSLSRMAVVTFTDKAAGELKLRIRAAIEEARARIARDLEGGSGEGAARLERLDRALEELESASVGTIHGLCADLLREHPVEAGVDPDFTVAAEDNAGPTLFARVFERWFDALMSSPPEGVRRILSRRPRAPAWAGSMAAQLLEGARRLSAHRDLDRPWTEPPLDLPAEVRRLLLDRLLPLAAQVRLCIELRQARPAPLAPILELDGEVRSSIARGEALDVERLEARLLELERPRGWRGAPGSERDLLEAGLDGLFAELGEFGVRSGEQLAARLRIELAGCLEAYEAEKRATGRLDFLDLLLKTRALLRSDAPVRAELQERFAHVLVDEFQDTDPLQLEILLLLASDDPSEIDPERVRPARGAFFVVGDPKQSIYRFRRADVEGYERVKRRLVDNGDAALLYLTTSPRSVPAIQAAVNAVFTGAMQLDDQAAQPGYVALSPSRAEIPGQPSLVALPLPLPPGEQWPSVREVRRVEPEAVAAFVEWLVRRSGWRVSERRDPRATRPVEARDVCLLFRSFRSMRTDLTRPYAQALEARGVRPVVVGSRTFFLREEIDALACALHVVEWPDDELEVYATLRGRLFGFDDEELLRFRRSGGRFSARRPGDPSQAREVRGALELLGGLHPGRNRRSLAETLAELLEETRFTSTLALRPDGDRAVGSVHGLQALARSFERSPTLSFRAFVLHLETLAQADHGEIEPTPVEDEGEGGVLLMTVHKAKGLEFPVVVLADSPHQAPRSVTALTDRPLGLYASAICGCAPRELVERRDRELKREQAESLRLLYVAATRARDLLVVPVGESSAGRERWLEVLLPALESRRLVDPEPPGCPRFSSTGAAPWRPTAPGLHEAKAGPHRFVLWDPDLLRARARRTSPLRHHDLLAETGEHAESRRRHLAFVEERARRLERASVPRCRLLAATALSHRPELLPEELLDAARAVRLDRASAALEGTAAGPRASSSALLVGSLAHAILERARPSRAGLETLARQLGLALGTSEEETAAALAKAASALAHPLLLEAAAAPLCHRELPVLLRLDRPAPEPPILVEGIIDLLYEDSGGLVVVDYKTDPEPDPARVEIYRRQVALYARAVRGLLPGAPVRAHLLFL
jgi:ATP-dependent helicase/nuclease subunit A